MIWHDLRDPNDKELDVLAERYHLHALHVEDCRHGGQRAKVEDGAGYLFTVLKPVYVNESGEVEITDFDLFLGPDYLITVLEGSCPTVRAHLDQLRAANRYSRPDQLFYKILDNVVDSYSPVLDWFNERIDEIEDGVLDQSSAQTLQRIFETKRGLISLRRVLSNMRDVAGHLQRTETDLIQRDLWAFLRDVSDHLARNMDLVEMLRDLLTGAMDIHLTSVANRTNQVMKVLTIMSTVALPAIVISGLYGMNTKGMPFMDSPHGSGIALGAMAAATAALLFLLKKFDWF